MEGLPSPLEHDFLHALGGDLGCDPLGQNGMSLVSLRSGFRQGLGHDGRTTSDKEPNDGLCERRSCSRTRGVDSEGDERHGLLFPRS